MVYRKDGKIAKKTNSLLRVLWAFAVKLINENVVAPVLTFYVGIWFCCGPGLSNPSVFSESRRDSRGAFN